MPRASSDELITLKDVAYLLKLHPRTARRRMESGEIPGYYDKSPAHGRGRWVSTRSAIQAHIEKCMVLRPGVKVRVFTPITLGSFTFKKTPTS